MECTLWKVMLLLFIRPNSSKLNGEIQALTYTHDLRCASVLTDFFHANSLQLRFFTVVIAAAATISHAIYYPDFQTNQMPWLSLCLRLLWNEMLYESQNDLLIWALLSCWLKWKVPLLTVAKNTHTPRQRKGVVFVLLLVLLRCIR